MNTFFSDTDGLIGFSLFGWLHLLTIAVLILAVYLLYRFRFRLMKWRFREQMRYLFAGIMFLNMTVYYGLKLYNGIWDFHVHLPLHFCFISGYLFMYALVTNRKEMFHWLYFFAFAGPLPAILLPDLTCGFDRFLYWQYFISHHFFLIVVFYCLFVLQWRVERKDIVPAIIKANFVFLLVFLFNQLFHTNYIMTSTLPSHILRLMPFLSHFQSPILLLELAGVASALFAYSFVLHDYNRRSVMS